MQVPNRVEWKDCRTGWAPLSRVHGHPAGSAEMLLVSGTLDSLGSAQVFILPSLFNHAILIPWQKIHLEAFTYNPHISFVLNKYSFISFTSKRKLFSHNSLV